MPDRLTPSERAALARLEHFVRVSAPPWHPGLTRALEVLRSGLNAREAPLR